MTGPLDWDDLVLGPVMDTFGEVCILTPACGGEPFTFTGVFDEGFKRVEDVPTEFGLAPAHVSSSSPLIGARASMFPTAPLQGDRVTLRNRRFVISEVQPDSHGGLHLVLNERNAPPEIFQ